MQDAAPKRADDSQQNDSNATSAQERKTVGKIRRSLHTLDELAAEAGVSRRFLEMEITRRRLVAIRMSSRVLRVRDYDWQKYLSNHATCIAN